MTSPFDARPLNLDEDNIAEAIRTRDSFVVYAPLGQRGQIRGLLRALVAEQGKRASITIPWYGVVEPAEGKNYADYFYVLVTE